MPLGKEDPVVQLGHAIAGRGRCLVVLDNFEQVAGHAEATLGHWLDRAAEACFVLRPIANPVSGFRVLVLTPFRVLDGW